MARHTKVSFIGGPYDGHAQSFAVPPENLFQRMALPVNSNVFCVLAGKPRGPDAPARSVAIYELLKKEDQFRYRFVESKLAQELNLGNWRV